MIYLLAFLIPALMYAASMAVTGIYPLGDNALLLSDIKNQFAAFYTYFKHVVISNDNLIYTFSKSLGGDMVGFSGYYLRNPFLFLMLLFDDRYIPLGITLMIGLQLSCMGLTMAVLLKYVMKRTDAAGRIGRTAEGAAVLTFSTAYAFMGYVFAYITLPIYFCDLILLPLVVLGIYRLFEGKRNLYIISLAASIVCNYYIGYMFCIFAVLFFASQMVGEGKLKEKKLYVDFALSSLIAGGLSAVLTVPTVLSLRGQKEAPSLDAMAPAINYGVKAFVRNLFAGAFRGDVSNSCAPYVYASEAALVFAFIWLTAGRGGLRKKAARLVLLAVLVLSTLISTIDVIWHGFNAPVGFAYRYSFLISFVLILTGFEGCLDLIEWRSSDEVWTGRKKRALYIILAIQLVLLTFNAVVSLRNHDNHPLSDYIAYYDRCDAFLSEIRNKDDSLYRLEKDFEYNHNDSMLFAYNGLTHNSSCEKDYVKEFMAKMGIRYFPPIWTFYNQGSTTFTDCFLGVRYFVSRFDSTIKPYEHDFTTQGSDRDGNTAGYYVYDNPYALPFCFVMGEKELATDMDNEDLFEIQNGLAGRKIYHKVSLPADTDITVDDELVLDVPIDMSCNLYFYATAPDYQGAELFVNGDSKEDYFSVSRWNIEGLGKFRADDTVKVGIKATDGPIKIDHIYIYEEDINELKEWYKSAARGNGELDKITSSHLSGNITVSGGESIVFSIPYEKGWKVRVDGKRVKTEEALGALLEVKAPAGDHTIDMIYIPEGMIFGLAVSLISLAAFIKGCIFGRNKLKF